MQIVNKRQSNIEECLRTAVRALGTARPGRKKGRTPMTRYQLAKLSGVSEGQLVRFVRGDRTITLASAAKLAEVLGLELRPKKKQKGR